MKEISVSTLMHRGNTQLALRFNPDAAFTQLLRKHLKIKWSNSNQCWYCLQTENNICIVKKIAQQHIYRVREQAALFSAKPALLPAAAVSSAPDRRTAFIAEDDFISTFNSVELKTAMKHLVLCGYSSSTARTYRNELIQFFRTIKKYKRPGP